MAVMEVLKLDTIKDLDDGRVAIAFDQNMKRAVQDCMDRPSDKKSRKVSIVCNVTPIVAVSGECEGAEVDFELKTSVPVQRTRSYTLIPNKVGHLKFSKNSPDAGQTTIFDNVDKEGTPHREE